MTSGRYDVLVIGAGLSGLTTAAFLAQGGARVLVCEQAAEVGGLFNSFSRAGYHFDGGIKAVENSAVMMPMLAQLGLLEQVHLRPSPIALITNGRVLPMRGWAHVVAYFHLLGDLFPGDVPGLRRVLRDARTVFELLDGVLDFPVPFFDLPGGAGGARAEWFKRQGAALSRAPRAARLMRTGLRPYLRRHLGDAGLVNLLSGLFPDGTSAFFGLGYFRLFLDYNYPRGGIQTIPRALAEALRGWGGEIRLNARVSRVLLEGGRACGVALSGGEEIRAGYVVAAADLRQTLTSLVPESLLPADFDAKLRRAEVSHSVFNVFLGLDMPPGELKLEGCQHVFYSPDLRGIDEPDRVALPDYFAHVPQEISVPCLHQPDLAPPGKTGLNISAMTSWRYRGGWEQAASDYEKRKDDCARQLIAGLEKFVPGLSERIELRVIATPRTIHARTSNTEGAIMGWSYDRGRTLSRGRFYQMPSSVLTPVPRLLVAGHWAFSPGGSPVAVLTGKLAAERLLKRSAAERDA